MLDLYATGSRVIPAVDRPAPPSRGALGAVEIDVVLDVFGDRLLRIAPVP